MMNTMGNFFGWGPGFGWLFMILIWILIIGGIVAIVKCIVSASSAAQAPQQKTALEILKERYARGEIDQAEFEQKKRDVES
jgi:putative membrane protein